MTTRKDTERGETINAKPPSRQRMAVAGAFTHFEDVVASLLMLRKRAATPLPER